MLPPSPEVVPPLTDAVRLVHHNSLQAVRLVQLVKAAQQGVTLCHSFGRHEQQAYGGVGGADAAKGRSRGWRAQEEQSLITIKSRTRQQRLFGHSCSAHDASAFENDDWVEREIHIGGLGALAR